MDEKLNGKLRESNGKLIKFSKKLPRTYSNRKLL